MHLKAGRAFECTRSNPVELFALQWPSNEDVVPVH
jgi:hypothetical protein